MKTFAPLAALGGAALLLSACGSADDASTEASADTVEMPADEALSAVTDEAVADPDATATDAPATDTEVGAGADQAADAAANVAAEAAAASEAASE
ncbi:MAG: hypothetical protein CVT75_13445 [Alphaproteobacteria bacterium HGW-Alphaproteobacteria-14]|nr:MAG: hypothetical protein CVT75_13445 [Alphaproteobacteria bacterium HGW-Alphaproteobacteria-14]